MAAVLWTFILSFIAAFITSMYCEYKRMHRYDAGIKHRTKKRKRSVGSVIYEEDRDRTVRERIQKNNVCEQQKKEKSSQFV